MRVCGCVPVSVRQGVGCVGEAVRPVRVCG